MSASPTNLAPQPDGVALEYKFVGLSRHLLRQQSEFALAMAINAIRFASGREIRPVRSPIRACPHERPKGLRSLLRLSGRVQRAHRSPGILARDARPAADHRRSAIAAHPAPDLRSGGGLAQQESRRLARFGRKRSPTTAAAGSRQHQDGRQGAGAERKNAFAQSRGRRIGVQRGSWTSCATRSLSSISKSRTCRWRRSPGCWVMGLRPRSRMRSGAGRVARHPPSEANAAVFASALTADLARTVPVDEHGSASGHSSDVKGISTRQIQWAISQANAGARQFPRKSRRGGRKIRGSRACRSRCGSRAQSCRSPFQAECRGRAPRASG